MSFINPDKKFWQDKRVLITGHTGFKGTWLSIWLASLGAKVQGYSLDLPTTPSLFEKSNIDRQIDSQMGDVRDFGKLSKKLIDFSPDIVFHCAAQSLVRNSYHDPIQTYSTNLMGTVNLFQACRSAEKLKAIVNITSDKCYENKEQLWAYRENDTLGGTDPYSNSKSCAELITKSFRDCFFAKAGIHLGSVRAGNVIGGGDWASERLVPDILRAYEKKVPIMVRNPDSIRPWQHVLEPLCGYLLLAEKLYMEDCDWAEGWNFGPLENDAKSVKWIVEKFVEKLDYNIGWHKNSGSEDKGHLAETKYLRLDISKVKSRLGWQPRWGLESAIEKIILWHQQYTKNEMKILDLCLEQIKEYCSVKE